MSNNFEYFDDPVPGSAGDDEPVENTWSQFDELQAIREQPNQARKVAMLRRYEAKYGRVSNIDKHAMGIDGY